MDFKSWKNIKNNISRNKHVTILSSKNVVLTPDIMSFKQLEKECSRLWSSIVLKESGTQCQWYDCQQTKNLAAHHLCSARCYRLRYNPLNGAALCLNHHIGDTRRNKPGGAFFVDTGQNAHHNNIWVYFWLPTIRDAETLKRLFDMSKEPNRKPTRIELIQTCNRLKYQSER